MDHQELAQRAYTAILEHFVREGRAPHYTELAERLGLSPDDAREIQAETAAAAPAATCWLAADTDHIEAWGPFSNLPTHNRVTVDGEEKWFAL